MKCAVKHGVKINRKEYIKMKDELLTLIKTRRSCRKYTAQ